MNAPDICGSYRHAFDVGGIMHPSFLGKFAHSAPIKIQVRGISIRSLIFVTLLGIIHEAAKR